MGRKRGNRHVERKKLDEHQAKALAKALLTFTSEEAVKYRLNIYQEKSLDLVRRVLMNEVPANKRTGKRWIRGTREVMIREIVRLWDIATQRNKYWNE